MRFVENVRYRQMIYRAGCVVGTKILSTEALSAKQWGRTKFLFVVFHILVSFFQENLQPESVGFIYENISAITLRWRTCLYFPFHFLPILSIAIFLTFRSLAYVTDTWRSLLKFWWSVLFRFPRSSIDKSGKGVESSGMKPKTCTSLECDWRAN